VPCAGFIHRLGGFVASRFRALPSLPKVRTTEDAQPPDTQTKETTMNAYNPISWKKKVVLAAVTLVVAGGVLEAVTSSMKYPDPEAMAVRERVLAAQSERAQQIRELSRGEVRVADTAAPNRI
jgi:hypothetical protein